MGRRERWSVIGDVLSALAHEGSKQDGRISNVAARANVAYDRLQILLDELTAAGLVVRGGPLPQLTQKGYEFLKHYRTWNAVLEDFGLD